MMCDALCSRCKKRYGWQGQPEDIPPCPRCGYQEEQYIVTRDTKVIQEFREYLAARKANREALTDVRDHQTSPGAEIIVPQDDTR